MTHPIVIKTIQFSTSKQASKQAAAAEKTHQTHRGFSPFIEYSQKTLDLTEPMPLTMASSDGVHSSSVADRTLEMCTPRLRWMPEHCVCVCVCVCGV